MRIIGNFQAKNYARIIGKDQLGCTCRVPFVVWLIVLEASPCLCIYLMMDGHKHYAVAVGEWCFSVVSICFDLYCEQPLRPFSLSIHRKCEVGVCAIVIVFKKKNNGGVNQE